MGKKRRGTVPLRKNNLRYAASKWLKEHKNEPFNSPYLTEQLGLNPISRIDCSKIYQDVISYWRKKFIDEYRKYKKDGKLYGLTRYEAWDVMLDNYNKNDAYVFLSDYDPDAKVHYFTQPSFHKVERMDMDRLEKQWRGIKTVVEEMQTYDAQLVLSDGKREPVSSLLKAGRRIDGLLGEKEA